MVRARGEPRSLSGLPHRREYTIRNRRSAIRNPYPQNRNVSPSAISPGSLATHTADTDRDTYITISTFRYWRMSLRSTYCRMPPLR